MKKKIVLCIFLAFISFLSCGKKDEKEENPKLLFIGKWQFSKLNRHTIVSLRNDGSWESEDRVEGLHTKVVEKKAKSTGRWNLEEDKRIVFLVESKDQDSLWPETEMLTYDILSLTSKNLLLQDDNGRNAEWNKIRAAKKEEGELPLLYQNIPMPPLILSLAKSRDLEKTRFLCLELEFVISLENLDLNENQEIPEPPHLHPEIREQILFYFLKQEYKDLNSFDKFKKHRLILRNFLNPYFDNLLHEIEIKNIIIASSSGSFNEFIDQYPDLSFLNQNTELK